MKRLRDRASDAILAAACLPIIALDLLFGWLDKRHARRQGRAR